MINYDSILSAFDGKPTLLQWLKLVKKALDESVLKDITLNQDGANVVFSFNFEDGTSISTPAVTLPKGDTGPAGPQGPAGPKGDKGDKGEAVGKVYKHKLHFTGGTGEMYTNIYSSLENRYSNIDSVIAILSNEPYQHVWFNGADGLGIGVIRKIVNDTFNLKIYSIGSGGTVSAKDASVQITGLADDVTEAK